jgi:aminoglycoside phosphotransferase (APT) family kinase protein
MQSPPEEAFRLLTLFCGLFLRLHGMDWKKLTPEPVKEEGDSSVYLREELLRAAKFGEETGINKEAGFRSVLRWLDERVEAVPPAPLAFTHNDFHPENVLLREDGSPSVIDWGSGQVSDYRLDLAWTLLLMGTHGSPAVRVGVLSEYERLRGEPVAGLEFFDVWASARRLYDIYLSLTGRGERSGLRPGAESLVRNQMPVVERVYELFRLRSGLALPEIERLLNRTAN